MSDTKLAKRDNTHSRRLDFAQKVYEEIGSVTVNRKQLLDFVERHGTKWPSWLVVNKKYRVDRGVYRLPLGVVETVPAETTESASADESAPAAEVSAE